MNFLSILWRKILLFLSSSLSFINNIRYLVFQEEFCQREKEKASCNFEYLYRPISYDVKLERKLFIGLIY